MTNPTDTPPKKVLHRGTPEMVQSDLEVIRVLDDLINALVKKGVLNWTDLPTAAVDKLTERSTLRQQEGDLSNLLGEGKKIL